MGKDPQINLELFLLEFFWNTLSLTILVLFPMHCRNKRWLNGLIFLEPGFLLHREIQIWGKERKGKTWQGGLKFGTEAMNLFFHIPVCLSIHPSICIWLSFSSLPSEPVISNYTPIAIVIGIPSTKSYFLNIIRHRKEHSLEK